MRYLWAFLAFVGLMGLGLTHLGRWAPLGDAMAVVRPHIIALGVPVALGLMLASQRRLGAIVALALITSATATFFDWRGVALRGSGTLTLYQKNLLWNGATGADLLADIRATQPDFITLQEVSRENVAVFDALAAAYPYQRRCVSQGNGGIAILSRYPLGAPGAGCDVGDGIVVARVALPDGRSFWLGAVHLNWPYPFDQARQVPGIIAGLGELDGPIVISGDFNMVPWGSAVRRIAAAADTARLGGYGLTFPSFGPLAPLAIDHVLIPLAAKGEIDRRPRFGSDHFGLLARFTLP